MAPSGFRVLSLLAFMVPFPALAVAGCGQPTPAPPPPQVLGSVPPGAAYGIVVDSTNAYVSPRDPGPVYAVPLSGGAAFAVGIQAQDRALAVDEQRLYWSDGKSILACDKANCAGSTVLLAASQFGVMNMALDDANVYWGTPAVGSRPGQIMKASKSGGRPVVDAAAVQDGGTAIDGSATLDASAVLDGNAPVAVAATNWPYNLAVDATSVYWIEQWAGVTASVPAPTMGLGPVPVQLSVMKAPLAGGPAVQVAVSSGPVGLVLDDDNVYFMEYGAALLTVPKNGGPTHALLSNLGDDPTGLAGDGKDLYIATIPTVVKVPLGGGFAGALATDLVQAKFLAVDASSVYVAASDSVLKFAK